MPVPIDITTRPDLSGTVPIDTAPAPAPHTNSAPSAPAGQPNDVAGVLRRNQACLACRRRKLKCDAVRPHCSTCVRSYRHLLRTAPGTQPVLSCEYDDSTERENGNEGHASPEEEEEGAKKKKRKTSTGARSKKREDGQDVERDRLTKRIAELEAQLAKKTAAADATTNARWSLAAGGFGPPADSPTALLEMLSTTATASEPAMQDSFPGLIPLWSSADRSEATGLTPFLPMPDPDIPDESGNRPPPSMLSPNGVFNFSPAPASLQWPPPNAVDPNDPWPTSADPSIIQNAVRHLGAMTGVASIGGSALSGPMIGPGASTPGPPGVPPGAAMLPESETVMEISMDVETSLDGSSSAFDATLNGDAAEAYAAAAKSGMDSQILVDLFWPGWPKNLPDPPVVTQLVQAFFDVVPNMPRILHRARFLSRLSLPPSHSNFPHPALLHAICALAGSWIQHEEPKTTASPLHPEMSRPEYYSQPGPTGKPSSMPFSLRQAAFGKDAVLDGLNTGNRLFDVVRAMIILSRVFIDDTRMLECWTYCGLVSRMILPLGLNVRSAELSLKSVMLPPPSDALEREERRIAVWMAMYHDTVASAASGWGTSLALDELTVPLPISAKDFDGDCEDVEANPQDLESLDLYIKHPVPDPFVMTLKGTVLLNRVSKFVRKWKNRRLKENDDLDGMHRPEFRELANAIACLQMSFPASLHDPTKLDDNRKLDVNTLTAHVIPHTAIICLYEPFADITDPNDQPSRRIINAARSIISVIQQVIAAVPAHSTTLAAVMHSASSVALVTAARTCLLFYRHALNMNDHAYAESFRVDIETARMALALYGRRFKIGYHHAQLIEYFLDRATNPTYEKLVSHYPEHPRPGGMVLTQDSNFGMCILNALNIKRGYWRIPGSTNQVHSVNSVSPGSSSPTNGVANGSGVASSPSLRNTSSSGSPSTDASTNPTSISSAPSVNGNINLANGINGPTSHGWGPAVSTDAPTASIHALPTPMSGMPMRFEEPVSMTPMECPPWGDKNCVL